MDSDSDSDSVADQRFFSFKMGGGPPPNTLHTLSRHSHSRSRSRSGSISSFPLSSSAPSLAPSAPDSPPLTLPSKRPASHHHRRSSVSTRHESAELMGVSLPELPTAHSDDNVNLGDRDSIRRRALWALEGRPDLAFSKVEIPDITSPDSSKPFDFPTKTSFTPGSALNGTNASLTGKRDSFGKMFGSISVSKDQLGTLVEEEEEEEEDDSMERKVSPKQVMHPPAKILTRHRPASLNLRPLSLVQGSIVSSVTGSLPTPTCTPGTHSNGPKVFAMVPPETAVPSDVIVPCSSAGTSTPSTRRFSYTCSDTMSAHSNVDKKRCSSISYKRSTNFIPRDVFSLPTPEMTPTERRFSLASDPETLIEQPLSAADQHFLYRSHHLLLSRITELERTLSNRSSPPRMSYSSDISVASSEPSDEMLDLISDLKAERDELKRDVDGWRQRLADADKQAGMLAKRIESERREAWVARSRLGLLEVKKSDLEKSLEAKAAVLAQAMAENAALIRERDEMKDGILKLNSRLKDMNEAVDECARLRVTLEQERIRRRELEKILDDAGLLKTPKLPYTVNGTWKRSPLPAKPVGIRGLGFQSVDSESSTTDVESADDSFTKADFALDAVAEEEVEIYEEENENDLVGYEDEDDSDLDFSSPDGSSVGSADELDIKPKVPTEGIPNLPIHAPRASLSKTWTFPRGLAATPIKQEDEVDRFFECLGDVDRSPPCSEETNQNTFSSVFQFMADDDELPPFVLPPDVGVVVESPSSGNLDDVPEEDKKEDADSDDELVGEEVEGGIRFTFNAPPIICVTPPPDVCRTPPPEIRITPPPGTNLATPAVRPRVVDSVSSTPVPLPESVEDDEDKGSSTFVFQPKHVEPTFSPSDSSPPSSSRPSSRMGSPPSSIPRAVSLRSISPKAPSITFTPSKNAPGRSTIPGAYSSPPSKKTSSSIPQPVTPPRYCSTLTKTSAIPSKSQSSTLPHSKLSMTDDFMSAPRCPNLTQSGGATSEVNRSNNFDPSLSSTCEYLHVQNTSLLSITSSPLATTPFQKLTNFISFTWKPGAAAVASYIVPNKSSRPNGETTTSRIGNGATGPAQRRFVPKARQLEKLRSRLALENGLTSCCMVSACKGCSAGDVYL